MSRCIACSVVVMVITIIIVVIVIVVIGSTRVCGVTVRVQAERSHDFAYERRLALSAAQSRLEYAVVGRPGRGHRARRGARHEVLAPPQHEAGEAVLRVPRQARHARRLRVVLLRGSGRVVAR